MTESTRQLVDRWLQALNTQDKQAMAAIIHAPEFPAPEWRAHWVERMERPAESAWREATG